MKKFLIAFLIVLTGLIGVFGLESQKTPTAKIGRWEFKLIVARSEKERGVGLSKFDKLPKDFGMIFLFDRPGLYSFWMKDMKFPIDIIFIRGNKIVTIYPDLKPPKPNDNLPVLSPETPSDKVLEINAGLSKKYNFKNGDEVKISNL